jgi:hypothetical protein
MVDPFIMKRAGRRGKSTGAYFTQTSQAPLVLFTRGNDYRAYERNQEGYRMKTLLTVMLLCTLANATATGLSLEDVLREVHSIPDVRLAELDLAAASLAVADANRPTYPSLTVSPGVRVIGGSELTDISRVGLSATATLSVPLGSGEENDVRSDALARSAEELEVAYADVRSRYI